MFPRETLVISSALGSAYWILLLITMSFNFAILFATLYFQVLHGQAPVAAALCAMMSFSWTAAGILVSGLQGRVVWVAIFAGVISILTGSIVLALGATSSSLLLPLVGLVLVGIGMGLANGHLVALAILAAPDGQSLLRAHLFKPCEHLAPVLVCCSCGYACQRCGSCGYRHNQQCKGEIRSEFPELVVAAVDWVHRGEVLLSAAAVVVTVIFCPARPTTNE